MRPNSANHRGWFPSLAIRMRLKNLLLNDGALAAVGSWSGGL
jgi:hypothetical protein